VEIKILSPVWSQVQNKEDRELLANFLYVVRASWINVSKYKVQYKGTNGVIKGLVREVFSTPGEAGRYLDTLKEQYPDVTFAITSWRQKTEVKNKVSLVKKGLFLTGFISRIKQYCLEERIDVTIEDASPDWPPLSIPFFLSGITPRVDQVRFLEKAIEAGRGLLVAPTGSGKTLLAAWLFSAFPNLKRLFLCHTLALVRQAESDFNEYFKSNECHRVTTLEGLNKNLSGNIVVATRQSFSKLPVTDYDEFDMVVVDEVHHVSSFKCEYAELLKNLMCPIRFGLTATLPTDREARMAAEGYLGPIIDEVTLEEGIEKEILAKPELRILQVPEDTTIKQMAYPEAYQKGIVERKARHRLTMKTAKTCVDKGESVLILIERIEHGVNLMQMAELIGPETLFIQGGTDDDIREEVKTQIKNKNSMCVIATRIWNEGVNIPSLDHIILAGDVKANLPTLQKMGRGLRRTDGKTKVTIWDFFDRSSKYFVDHFGERISLYCQMKINVIFD